MNFFFANFILYAINSCSWADSSSIFLISLISFCDSVISSPLSYNKSEFPVLFGNFNLNLFFTFCFNLISLLSFCLSFSFSISHGNGVFGAYIFDCFSSIFPVLLGFSCLLLSSLSLQKLRPYLYNIKFNILRIN